MSTSPLAQTKPPHPRGGGTGSANPSPALPVHFIDALFVETEATAWLRRVGPIARRMAAEQERDAHDD